MKIIFILILMSYSMFANAQLDQPETEIKLWLWPDSSQIQVNDHFHKKSILINFEYNEIKTRITNLEIDVHGSEETSSEFAHVKDLKDFIKGLSFTEETYIFLFGPRVVDPLGPQPGERMGVNATGLAGKKSIRSVFGQNSWAVTRKIIQSSGTQSQIDFELFQSMILQMLEMVRENQSVGYGWGNPSSSMSCQSLFAR